MTGHTLQIVGAEPRRSRDHPAPWLSLRAVTDGQTAVPLAVTMHRWNDSRHQRQEVAYNTWRAARGHIRGMVAYFGPDCDAGAITAEQVEDWLATLECAARSRNTYLGTYRGFFGWARRRGLIEVDPFTDIGNAKVGEHIPRRVKVADVERVLMHADFRARVLITLAVGLGPRRAELAGLRVEDWDPAAGTLLINGKGSKQRVVPVAGEPHEALTAWLGDGRTSGPMFPSWDTSRAAGRRRRDPTPLSPNRVAAIMLEASLEVGLRITPHQYRHTCAYELLSSGASIEVVRRLLGHKDISTTGRYLAASVDDIRPHIGQRSYYRGVWGNGQASGPGPDFT